MEHGWDGPERILAHTRLFFRSRFLALPMSRGRVTVSLGRVLLSPGGLLVAFIVFAFPMMFRGSTMRLGGVLVMLGSSRVCFLRHFHLHY